MPSLRALIDAVHATEDDCDDIAGLPGRAEGVVVSVTIRELADGRSKISVRSNPEVDACAICASTAAAATRWPPAARWRATRRRLWKRSLQPSTSVARMNGILLVDKPADWTSHDVVAKLRGVLGERRMGHSGTLDPMATGLLVVFAGRATRAVSFSENHSKCYEARLRLGLTTDTQDTTGTVLSRSDPRVTRAELEAVLPQFRGEILQVPPMYSALKVDGQKLYEIARRGGEVARKARPVTIEELTVLGEADGDYVLRVRCSKGTYIRTLCHDIGAALGCGGVMSALRRTEVGGYRVEDAHTMDALCALPREAAQRLLLPVDSLWPDTPQITIGAKAERLARCGNPFALSAPDGTYRIYAASGAFLLLAQVTDGTAVTIKSFFEVS
ncbi:MAG: tRNA pseudouridine(55) synthase TruB [Oscillospiraceae bacterium]